MNVHPTGPIPHADSYAWPGGYPLAYLVDDGEILCPACVNDSANPVHFGGDADGWRVDAYAVLYEPEDEAGPTVCAHCDRIIISEED